MTGADTSPGAETGDRSPPPCCWRRRRRVLIPAALLAIVGAVGVSMPALAAVLFDPLPPGEESVVPITPPPQAKPLTGTEWRAQDPRRSTSLLPVELRPKQRIPCAEALSDERLRNPADALEEMGRGKFSELFRSVIEISNCNKKYLREYIVKIGATNIIEKDDYDGYYVRFDLDTGLFVSLLFWIPEARAVFVFDDSGELIRAGWGGNK